jgi:hypothetical protein
MQKSIRFANYFFNLFRLLKALLLRHTKLKKAPFRAPFTFSSGERGTTPVQSYSFPFNPEKAKKPVKPNKNGHLSKNNAC